VSSSCVLMSVERQHPVFQAQMHVRRRVPFLKIMTMDAMFAKLGVAN
jgi:hypothetical protein